MKCAVSEVLKRSHVGESWWLCDNGRRDSTPLAPLQRLQGQAGRRWPRLRWLALIAACAIALLAWPTLSTDSHDAHSLSAPPTDIGRPMLAALSPSHATIPSHPPDALLAITPLAPTGEPTSPERAAASPGERQSAPPPGEQRSTQSPVPRPSPAEGPSEADFRLEGIMLGLGGDFAVLNGQIVSVGQTVLGATVSRIDERGVYLRVGDRVLSVPLSPVQRRPEN
jgi:hypothetical protein